MLGLALIATFFIPIDWSLKKTIHESSRRPKHLLRPARKEPI
jgi:hypothetical protein